VGNPKDVAAWMAQEVATRELYQDEAATYIQRVFGAGFVYENSNGNLAISKDVLKEFSRINAGGVVWERRVKLWRKRNPHDDPGRSQD
jgi:hypothetical protein